MSRLLVASYYTIQDLATGGKRRVHELVSALAPDVMLVQPDPPHPDFPVATFPVDFGRRKFLINWGIFNLKWPRNRRNARAAAQAISPSAIVLDSIWCHDAFSGLGIPRVLDAQNVDALAIRERFGKNHPFSKMVHACERRVVSEVDLVFCCSDIDAATMRELYGVDANKLVVAPNGARIADETAEDPAATRFRAIHRDKTVLLFMGKLDYAPNVEALEFVANRLLPALEKRHPGRFVCVVTGGPGLPPTVKHPAVVYAGRVPVVAPWIKMADICLAPVFSGSGTRLKILEYMGLGRPVVATAKAAEGLDVVDGRDVCLAERDGFADAVSALAAAPEKAAEIAARGQQLIKSNYTWDRTAHIWRTALASFR